LWSSPPNIYGTKDYKIRRERDAGGINLLSGVF
jgi:hypothetical protein